MKKGIVITMLVGVFFSLTTIGCSEKYTPLTQEQVTAKADSVVNASKDAKVAELKAACDASAEAQANAKFEELKAAATASK